MKVDVMIGGRSLRYMQEFARATKQAGFSGLVITEAGRTAYLSCAAVTLAEPDLDISTGIAVAFPRSPMVTASTAWELADASRGRFRLGLGTQVRAHIERRYGTSFDPPGPRLEEYVQAVRAIFRAFRGERLDFRGKYFTMNLLPRNWAPGELAYDDPPIDIAAVGPWMLRMAGRVADGVHLHPISTDVYLRTTVAENIRAGQAEAGRAADSVQLIAPCFTVVGVNEREQHVWREMVRTQVAFYGSTPNYAFIFEQIGHGDVTARLREAQKAGDTAAMNSVITDEILDHFIVAGAWDDLSDALVARYGGLVSRVALYNGAATYDHDPHNYRRLGEVARDVMARTGEADRR